MSSESTDQIELNETRPPIDHRVERDARYREIVQSAIDFGIIATDLDGKVIEWNTGAEHLLGWRRDEKTGQTVDSIFTEEDIASGMPAREMASARDHGRTQDERWHVRKDGRRFWASGEMMPLRDAAGMHVGYLKILRDRTPQHLAQQALQRAQANLQLAQDAGGIGVFWVDNDALLHASPAFCNLYGLPFQEVHDAATFERCVLPEDLHMASNAMGRAAGIAPLDVEYRIRRADTGALRWIGRKGNFEFDEHGRPTRFAGAARDITLQVAARDALLRSDERYRALFNSMDQGFAILDVLFDEHDKPFDCRYLEVNEVFEKQSGIRNAAGRAIRELVPSIEAFWFDIYGGVVQSGRAVHLTDHAPSMGRWFEISAVRIGDAGRHRVGVLFSDVTQRKQAELHQAAIVQLGDALRDLLHPEDISTAASALLGETLGVSMVGYGVVDAKAETVLAERGWAQPGVTPLQGLLHFRDYGSYVDDLKRGRTAVVHDARRDPRTRDNADALIERAAAAFVNTPIMERGEFVALFYVSHREPRRWHESELALIREFGERTRVASDRASANLKRIEQAERLADLNANLEREVQERTEDRNALWQLSGDIMLRARFDGVMTAVNPAWQDVLGWSDEELIGKSLFDLIHPDDLEHTLAGASQLSQGKSHARFDNRYRRRDGSYRWISWTTRPGDGLINAVGRDITEEIDAAEALKKSEAALRQSQKMEAVGQLTGGLAHDFNILLAGITGALELMSVRLRQGRIQDLERYVGTAQSAARRAAALTHRLLAFSRRQTLDPKPTDVNLLIHQVEDLVRRTIGPEIALDVQTAPDLWITLIDPPQLENALLNLSINARDAMPDGGRIVIQTANRHLALDRAADIGVDAGAYVSISVTDTGTGMAPDVIAKAFDPFFTTKALGQGTGLGLSMVYGFVQQSGGQVRIRSKLGEGTTMTLYLPRYLGAIEEVAVSKLAPVAPPSATARTVLIVDDEPTVRMLVTEVLEDRGYRVAEAADGASGLHMLESNMQIDLLVTDVGLPGGMNGRQMADAARLARPGLKVLFITGYAEDAVVGKTQLDVGMEVMTKPFQIDAFSARVASLLQ